MQSWVPCRDGHTVFAWVDWADLFWGTWHRWGPRLGREKGRGKT